MSDTPTNTTPVPPPWTGAEDMVLNFDGWMQSQPSPIQKQWGSSISAAPDPEKEKKVRANVAWIAEHSGMHPADVARNYRTARGGFAASAGFSKEAGEDDMIFNSFVTDAAAKQRDERVMLQGTGKDDDEGRKLFESSMTFAALQSGSGEESTDGRPGYMDGADDYLKWVSHAKDDGSFRPENAHIYLAEWARIHRAASADWAIARQAAENVMPVLQGLEHKGGVTAYDAAPFLRGLTDNQMAMMQRQLAIMAEKPGGQGKYAPKGDVSDVGEAFGRMLFNIGSTLWEGMETDVYDRVNFAEGKLVKRKRLDEGMEKFVEMEAREDPLARGGPKHEFVAMTAAQAAEANAIVARKQEDAKNLRKVREIAQGTVLPINYSARDNGDTSTMATIAGAAKTFLKYPAVGVAESIPIMGLAAIPGAGPAVLATYYTADAKAKLTENGAPADKAGLLAPVVGVAQAAGDMIQLSLLKKLPGLPAVLSKWGAIGIGPSVIAPKWAQRLALTTWAEIGVEHLQDFTPKMVQDFGAVFFPDVEGTKDQDIVKEIASSTVDMMPSMLMLSAVGTWGASHHDVKAFEKLARDSGPALEALGIAPAGIEAITSAQTPQDAQDELRHWWITRVPVVPGDTSRLSTAEAMQAVSDAGGEAITKAVTARRAEQAPGGIDANAPAPTEGTLFPAAPGATDDTVPPAADEEPGTGILRRDDKGWNIVDEKGGTIPVGTVEAGHYMQESQRRAASQAHAEALMSIADTIATMDKAEGKGSEISFSGDLLRASKEGDTVTVSRGQKEITFDEGKLANLHAEMKDAGLSEAIILGSNEALADDTGRMVRHYQTNQGAGVHTIMHERIQRMMREKASDLDLFQAANVLAALPIFDPAKIRDPKQRAIAEKLHAVARDEPGMTRLDKEEAMVELMVADVLGRAKDKTPFQAGAIETALREAAVAAATPKQRAEIGRVRGLLRMVKSYLKAMFGLASRIAQARRKGELKEGDSWTDLVDRLVGISEQKRHNAAVTKDAGVESDAGTFSLQPVDPSRKVPVVEVSDSTLEGANIKEIRAAAFDYAAGHHIYGQHENADTGWKIMVNKESLAHTFVHPGAPQIHAVPSLPELIRTAVHTATAEHKGDGTEWKAVYRLRSAMGFRGGLYSVKLTVKEHIADGHKLYDLQAIEIEKEPGGKVLPSAEAETSTPGPAPGSTVTLGEIAPEIKTFSLASIDALETIAQRLENMGGGAQAKREMYANMGRTISGMARAARQNEDTERVLALGEIDKKRVQMRGQLVEKYIGEAEDEIYSRHSDILSNASMAQIFEDDLMDYLFKKKEAGKPFRRSRILSRAAAEKKGMDVGGDYDGAGELPQWMFSKDGLAPDKILKELIESGQFGLSENATPDDLWHDIGQALDNAEKYRKAVRAVEGELIEAREDARLRASTEAREWAATERAKLALSDKRDEKRALIALDAMLMHLPAEVRGRVGGFTKLSELTTNKARTKHFNETLEKIDATLEDYLRRETMKAIRETIVKGQAKRMAGEKDRGKLGVNAHTWLEQADAVMAMSESRLKEREAYIEERLSGKVEMDSADIKELTRSWDFGNDEAAARMALEQESGIIELFGGLTHKDDSGNYIKDSGELEAALGALRETVLSGRQGWQRQLIEKRERRAGRRAGVQIDSKNSGALAAVAERAKATQKFGEKVTAFFRKGFDFQSFVGDIFGRGSDTHIWAEDIVRESELTASGLWQKSQNDLTGFLKSLWPRTAAAGRLQKLESLATPRAVPGAAPGTPELSELQALHFTMAWADEGSRDWLRKYDLGDGEPVNEGDKQGVDTQAALEEFLSPEAKEIRSWLQDRYDAQYDLLNAVYRRIHGVNLARVKNYAPRMVEHGKDVATLDPLSPGGLSARGVFAGFTKRRRINLASAPVIADALQAFTQNQKVVTHFLAWAEAATELRAVFSTSQTAPFIKAAAGETGAQDLNQWLTDLESGGVREAQASSILQRYLKANVRGALVGKLAVLAKQLPAMYGAAVEIGWGDYMKSLRRVMNGTAAKPPGGAVETRIMKSRGFERPPEIGQAASGTGATPWTHRLRRLGVDLNRVDLSLDWLGGRIGATDAWFTARGAAVAYDAHFRDAKAEHKSDTDAHAYALKEMERTIARTAQPDSLANKSLNENHAGTMGRLFSQFQSANRQALYMTIAAFSDGGIKSTEARRKVLTHWALTGLVTQFFGAAIRDMMSDDDDDEDWRLDWNWSDYARAMAMGPITGMYIAGPIIDAVATLLLGGYEPRIASPGGTASDTGKVVAKLIDPEKDFEWRDTEKLARGLGLLLGGKWAALGVGANLGKQLLGAADNLKTTDQELKERKARLLDAKEKQAKEEEEAAKSAADRAEDKADKAQKKQDAIERKSAQFDEDHPEGQ